MTSPATRPPTLDEIAAIARDEATFGPPEVNWGILPGGPVSKKLTDTLLFRDAMYYARTGRTLDGKRAAG